MIIKTKFRIGAVEYEIQLDEAKEMDCLHKSIVLSNAPRFCPLCKNNQFFALESNIATTDEGSFTYVNVVCRQKDCYAKAKLGQYKAGGYFWHKFEKYVKKDNGSEVPNTD